MEVDRFAQLFLFLNLMLNVMVTMVAWRLTRPMPGPPHWALSAALMALGGVFTLLGGALQWQSLLWVQNVLFVCAYAFLAFGTNAFLDAPKQPRRLAVWVGVAALMFAYFHFVEESFRWRVVLSSLCWGIGSIWVAFRLWQVSDRYRGAPRTLSILCWSGLGGFMLVRGVLATLGTGLHPDLPFQSGTYLFGLVLIPISISSGFLGLILLTVQRLVAERRDAEAEARNLAEQFRLQARTDALTGALNRRSFFERMQLEEARRDRQGLPIAVLMIDLDHFKRLNDSLGHAAGDEALRKLASVVEPLLRPTDVFARIGGEEFAVGLVGADPASAQEVAERIRLAIHDIRISTQGGSAALSASIGVSRWSGAGQDGLEAALAQADAALYQAKTGGRDRVVVADAVGELASPTAQ